MNVSKYVSLAKTSKATATRDLQDLLEKMAFIQDGKSGGRSTKYQENYRTNFCRIYLLSITSRLSF